MSNDYKCRLNKINVCKYYNYKLNKLLLPDIYNIDDVSQATIILDFLLLINNRKSDKINGIALLYSGNTDQVKPIMNSYTQNNNIFGNQSGGGLASLFMNIESLIKNKKYKEMQSNLHIIPVPTSMHGGSNDNKSNQIGIKNIKEVIINIHDHLSNDWLVFGLYNENGNILKIGGGITSPKLWDTNIYNYNITDLTNMIKDNPVQMHTIIFYKYIKLIEKKKY